MSTYPAFKYQQDRIKSILSSGEMMDVASVSDANKWSKKISYGQKQSYKTHNRGNVPFIQYWLAGYTDDLVNVQIGTHTNTWTIRIHAGQKRYQSDELFCDNQIYEFINVIKQKIRDEFPTTDLNGDFGVGALTAYPFGFFRDISISLATTTDYNGENDEL